MKVLGIGLKRPAISPTTIVMTMVFLTVKVLECLWVMKDADLGIKISSSIPLRNCGVYCHGEKSVDYGRGGYRSQDTRRSC